MPKREEKNIRHRQAQHNDLVGLFDTDWHTDPIIDRLPFLRGPLVRMSDMFSGVRVPAVDIIDEGSTFKILADMPGVEKRDIKVRVEENYITIRAHKTSEHSGAGKGFYSKERSTSSYYRSLSLPEGVRAGTAKAKFSNGTLEISVEKLNRDKDYINID